MGIFCIISSCVYCLHPHEYSYSYNLLCLLLFIASFIVYLKLRSRKNYFDFDFIFLTTFFFAFYTYPVFLYPINPQYFFIFSFEFNENVISQATALATMGGQMYMLGEISVKRKGRPSLIQPQKLPLKVLIFITILTVLACVLHGGYNLMKRVYAGDATIESASGSFMAYLSVLSALFIFFTISAQFNNLVCIDPHKVNFRYVKKWFLLFLMAYMLLLLSAGSRGQSLGIVLALGGLYTLLFRPMGLKLVMPMMAVGIFILAFISYTRGGGDFSLQSFWDLFIDLIVVNRNSFIAIDYVDTHGFTYGISMLSYLLKPIPFLQGFVFNLFGINPSSGSSAMLFSVETLGENPAFGVGTNIIADLYLAFGAVGVAIFMYVGGRFVAAMRMKAASHCTSGIVIYTLLVANAVYQVRAEYFYSLQSILWSLLLLYVVRTLSRDNMAAPTKKENDATHERVVS